MQTPSKSPSGDGPARRRHLDRWRRRAPALALAVLAGAAAVAVLVVAVLGWPGERYQTDELVNSLLAPTVDKTTILVRVVLLVASAAVAGLALARVLVRQRGGVEAPPVSVSTTSGEKFAEMFADLSASVSVEVSTATTTATSTPTPTPNAPRPDTAADAAASGGARPYAEVPSEVRVVAWTGGLAVAAACVAAALTGQAARPVVAVQLALSLAVPLVITDRRRVFPVGLAGVALAAMLGVEFGAGRSGLPLALDVIYAIAGSVLLGTSVFGVGLLSGGADPGDRSPVGDRLSGVALASGVLVTAAGVAQLLITGPRTLFDLLHTGYGVAASAQAAFPVLVTVVWLFASAPKGRPKAAELSRLAAGALTFALLAAAMVATFPLPLPAPEPGQPLLRPVSLGLRHLAVLVTPMRPGRNLVHVGDAGGGQTISEHGHGATRPPVAPSRITISADSATDAPQIPLTARPGAPGTWAVLDIPAGTDSLRIAGDGITATVPVDVGTTTADPAVQAALSGPDGPECASAALGGLLSGAGRNADRTWAPPQACPSQSLTGGDASALRDTVTFLAGRGIRALEVVSDDSPRGRAATELVRAEASRLHLPTSDTPAAGDTLLVLSGWQPAKAALDRATAEATDTPGGGITLAPWLLTGGILSSASSEVLPLTFNPQNLDPRQYASAVSTVFPGETPSAAGYLAWAAQHGSPLDSRATFYGAAQVNVPMGMGDDMDMGSEPSDWYPGGTVVPINLPLTAPQPVPHNP
jgi:hypothetical protein